MFHHDQFSGLSVSRALAKSESPIKKDSATEKKINKNSKVEEATETEVVQGDAGAREATSPDDECPYCVRGYCMRRPDDSERCRQAWELTDQLLSGRSRRLVMPDSPSAVPGPVDVCDHELVTLGNRRWCLKRYGAGGCGGHWRRADKTAPWMLDEVRR